MGRFSTLVVVVSLAACGGGGKGGDTTPDEGSGDDGTGGDDGAGSDDGMIAPETLDGIKITLDRKRNAATHCLTEAIDAGELDKTARGAITLGFVIEPSGKPRDVKVLESDLKSELMLACVAEVVARTTFDELPRELDWSYTFAFEAY